jgi:DNA-binding Xre family transcriptional regulator
MISIDFGIPVPFDGAVAFEDRHALPNESGVYFVIASDKVLYIGQAYDLAVRWKSKNHHRYPEVKNIPSALIAYLLIDIPCLTKREVSYITRFSPPMNGTTPPPRKRSTQSHKRNDIIDGIRNNLPQMLFDRGISITQLSEETGIGRSTMHNIVNGHTKGMVFEHIISICRALGVEIGDIYELAEVDND